MQEFKELAIQLADEARKIVKEFYRQPFEIVQKSDASPVTIADQSIEARIRDVLADRRPQDGVLGEEYENKESQSGLTWVIDPIDGTKSFMIGRPTFGTLIALCDEHGAPILGLIDQAITDERWIGVQGEQSTLNGAPIQTRPCAALENATFCSTTPAMFKDEAIYKKFDEGRFAWGGDCYSYGLLAAGFLDVVIEDSLKPYDFAALVPVINGAGGKICDYQGQDLTIHSPGDVVALGDPNLWEDIQTILKS